MMVSVGRWYEGGSGDRGGSEGDVRWRWGDEVVDKGGSDKGGVGDM
nr:hypothetical protein [Tanacetum cinerariifolium]